MLCGEVRLLIQIGDVYVELENETYIVEQLKNWLPFSSIHVQREPNHHFYFSDPFPIEGEGKEVFCSRVGDVCFFPIEKRFVLYLTDDELMCGFPRIRIGSVKKDIQKLISLTDREELIFIWEFTSRRSGLEYKQV